MDPFGELLKKVFFRGNNAKYEEMVFTSISIAGYMLVNWHSKRPVLANLPLLALVGAGAWMSGAVVHDWNYQRKVERELAIWDFVKRNPEHFPELKAKKYKDLLLPWTPMR